MLKKTVSVIVEVLLMLCSMSAISFAEDSSAAIIQPFYSHVDSVTASLSNSNGSLMCYAKARSQFNDTQTVLVATLQKRADGTTSWSKVCSWSDT